MSSEELISTTQRFIKNSGLALLHDFLFRYFDLVGLLDDNHFNNEQNQRAAVHYLQFLASGAVETQAYDVVLNNILCGLDINQSIDNEFTLPVENKEIAESLLHAVIKLWPMIGDCSLNAFRENWLMRDGWLTETEQYWQLTIERRAYDILLDKYPLSYKIIMFPWMKKPLHVS